MCLTRLYRSPDAVTAHVHQRAESAVQVEVTGRLCCCWWFAALTVRESSHCMGCRIRAWRPLSARLWPWQAAWRVPRLPTVWTARCAACMHSFYCQILWFKHTNDSKLSLQATLCMVYSDRHTVGPMSNALEAGGSAILRAFSRHINDGTTAGLFHDVWVSVASCGVRLQQ